MTSTRDTLLAAFAEHQDSLKRYLARRLGNAALAEDLTQETWLRAAQAEGTAIIGNPRAYLFRIAANLALDHQRHVAKGIELEAVAQPHKVADRNPSPENVVLHRSEFARLLRVVDNLSPRCREVFILAKFEERTYAEIAALLGISRNTVISHMVTALAAIEREMPAEKLSDPPPIGLRRRPS
ncbi:MAG: RNA polymerase sigma factor [Ferrovibrio sp.]|uniref:RNA polymerase sigma factor n=1 Tax=Ferrovibrio sp. TaxID=1917215 RepID=UPI00391A81A1